MDAKQTAHRGGEVSMVENKAPNYGQVVVEIKGEGSSKPITESSTKASEDSPRQAFSKSVPISCSSPEISSFSCSPNRPPKVPTNNENFTRRQPLARSVYSKQKSRIGEQPYSTYYNMFDDNGSAVNSKKLLRSTTRRVSLTPKTRLMEDDEEIYKKVKLNKAKHRKVKAKALVELIVFACILGWLVASFTAERLKTLMVWGLEFWKWCVLVMVIFSGMLVTNWFMHVVVFLIERNFLLRKKVLYFVHGLKKSVQVYIWLSLVLLTCVLLVNHGVKRSKTATKILGYVTRTLVSLLIGSFLWLMKTLLLKILASNFHVNTFFDRIQESIFHQYVLQTLSGTPLVEEAESVGKLPGTGRLTFRSAKQSKGKKEIEVIDIGKLHKMKHGKVSAWTMKVLVDAVMSSGLSTISNALDESVDNDDESGERTDKEITSEMEATAAAYHIFRNVGRPGCKYIDENDLLRFMVKEEVDLVFPLLEGGETGRIDSKDLSDWVVTVYKGRKALAHALNDTKTAVKQLNKIVTVILIVVTTLVWLLLMEIATTRVLVFLSSQLVVVAFIFGNTCKTIFEAIIFVFVMHPFDVGDRCVIDDIPMMVEEMNILTTVFLKIDNEKVYYPNSVLATKPISNYYRSPDMGGSADFSIDFMTPVDRIGMLKDKITQ
ncbi:hypothetical protein SLA2020_439230 [Shorea laevis]